MRVIFASFMLAAPFAAAAENWTLDTSDDVAITQDGGNSIKDESWSKDVVPRMQFSCAPGGEIIASIDWQRFISSFSTEVGFSRLAFLALHSIRRPPRLVVSTPSPTLALLWANSMR